MTGTIAEVAFPAERFALGHTLDALDSIRFDIEQVVAYNHNHLMPFVWVGTDNRQGIETALTADESVRDFQLVGEFDTECLYRLEWVKDIDVLIQILVEENGTVLAATGKEDTWKFRLLFSDHDAVTRTYEYCRRRGIDLELQNIHEFSKGRTGRYGLTQSQQQTLMLAYETGYYSIPRSASATDLADSLGVTHQSISEKLRRGHANLLKNTLALNQ
ncbi:DNA-binding protein [Haladaptatus sp. W1]|uniref:helix-turn-helix domain-containing protein n=1 Tax=Haladaptatus sp. W1 TaxID=1897478 RepID=UPI0008498F88|nr:helix-turn-helix domain-containing protein [Haladaptatus sp. W1]ODR81444.1 DNA-binding protein [Haladaptatus sp. W1]